MSQTISDLKSGLLRAHDGHLDASVKPLIEKWGEPPTALQILEVLDHCVYAGLASGFIMGVFEILLKTAIESECTTYQEVVAQATWRNRED